MVGLHLKDLIKKGNTGGILFGQPLYRTDADGDANLAAAGVQRATPYHLEAYYKFKVNDNVSITQAPSYYLTQKVTAETTQPQ